MTFEDLNLTTPLLKALKDLGMKKPTPIQHKIFSVVMSGKDVCGIAQTGTGKTYAYLLPSLRQLQFSKERLPQLLILVPTRELVVQVVEEIHKLGKYLTLEAAGLYGGGNIKVQMAQIKAGSDIVVATPGRLIDLLMNGSLKVKNIRKLVIDEVDEMLNLGFRPQLNTVLDLIPTRRQNLLFSATINKQVQELITIHFNNPEWVEAAPAGSPLSNIEQIGYDIPNFFTKLNMLNLLLEVDDSISKVLIFTESKKMADELFNKLSTRYEDHVGVIHSNKDQNYRFQSVNRFQDGTYRILIATDIIARGLDLTEVTHVVNFDIPAIPENYIHRIGRTGRADQPGIAISFIRPTDSDLIESIEELMEYEIPRKPLPANLIISELLTYDEEPKVLMKSIEPRRGNYEAGPAFHEKKAKNTKVNVRRNHAEEKMKKYGRPIKRSGKK